MNESARGVTAVVDVSYLGAASMRASLRALSDALEEAAEASAPGEDNAANARAALRLVEVAATRIPRAETR